MGFMHEFPNTRMFDSDLKEIINLYISIKGLPQDFADLKKFVTEYFDNLDVQNEINNKIDALISNGTLYQMFNEIIHYATPQMFGGKGDGINDDTESINNAIESIADGGVLYVPEGTYLISGDGIKVTKPISIIGANMGKTKIKAVEAKSNIFISADNVTLRNFTLYSDGVLTNTAIMVYKQKECVLDSITVENVNSIGIGFSNAYKCIVRDCKVRQINVLSPAFWCGYDTDYDGIHGFHLLDNVEACNIGLDGFICDDNGVTVQNSRFTNCGTLTPTGGALGACGIYCDKFTNPIKGITITNCVCNQNSESGIDLNFAENVKIAYCTCAENALAGIVVREGTDVLIIGNTTVKNGTSKTTANPQSWSHSGIAFTNKVGYLRIIDNLSADPRTIQTQCYGIEYLYDGEEHSSDVIIMGNNLKYNKMDNANVGNGYSASAINNLIYDGLNS